MSCRSSTPALSRSCLFVIQSFRDTTIMSRGHLLLKTLSILLVIPVVLHVSLAWWHTEWQLMYRGASLCFYLRFFDIHTGRRATSVHQRSFSYPCISVIYCITFSWHVTAKYWKCSMNSDVVCSFVLSGVAVGCWQSFDVPSATASAEA